jgi:hypothetical protein
MNPQMVLMIICLKKLKRLLSQMLCRKSKPKQRTKPSGIFPNAGQKEQGKKGTRSSMAGKKWRFLIKKSRF